MEKIAFISGGIFIYWSSIILALAALAAIAIFAAVYLGKSDDLVGASVTVPLAMVASIALSRLIHWYCRSDAYESMNAAMTDYTKGGYALMGVFIACLIVAALLRLFRVVKNLLQMYDSMAIGAGVGIAVGLHARASRSPVCVPDAGSFHPQGAPALQHHRRSLRPGGLRCLHLHPGSRSLRYPQVTLSHS